VFGKEQGTGTWVAGDRLVQHDLANTLRAIASRGADGFYQGTTAELIAAEMERGGGLITTANLAAYQAKERQPIHGTFRGFDVYAPPPPSSGGVTLMQMLNLAEHFDLRQEPRWSPRTLHLMIEAMRQAYYNRARFLGDPDFVKIPPELTTKEFAARIAKNVPLTAAGSFRRVGSRNSDAWRKPADDALQRHRCRRPGRLEHLHAGEQFRFPASSCAAAGFC